MSGQPHQDEHWDDDHSITTPHEHRMDGAVGGLLRHLDQMQTQVDRAYLFSVAALCVAVVAAIFAGIDAVSGWLNG